MLPQPADYAATDSTFLSFTQVAVRTTTERMPEVDRSAMTMVMLLHRVANSVVYDLESTVHRPAGWSWSAFRLLFTLWVAGPIESRRVAGLTGMSRAAVSSLTKTLSSAGLLARASDPNDGRAVVLSLTEQGSRALETAYRAHNRREAEWAHLLTADELATLNEVLTKLARAAQTQAWVNHRDKDKTFD
jgi:DNA-binding MarR family transcriptional regulator